MQAHLENWFFKLKGILKVDVKKKQFLENYVKIFDYKPLTPPIVYSITFDKVMKYALVHYGMIMEGGHAFLKKENGKWVIISAKRIWQE